MNDLAKQIILNAFDGKVDKGGRPYTEHLFRVAANVKQFDNESIMIVALLHDLLEDCPEWNEKSLGHLFNSAVVRSVVAITKKPGQSYDDYLKQVKDNSWATIVKLADLRDNMDITRLKELTDDDFKRLQKYHEAYKTLK